MEEKDADFVLRGEFYHVRLTHGIASQYCFVNPSSGANPAGRNGGRRSGKGATKHKSQTRMLWARGIFWLFCVNHMFGGRQLTLEDGL
mmetsp:Transcript_17531/g.35075  ORF Transcript_17531/g.35075 Transcript_17531/m.35075 type:complete len:88 (+) Transcript_17531:69-332(+)